MLFILNSCLIQKVFSKGYWKMFFTPVRGLLLLLCCCDYCFFFHVNVAVILVVVTTDSTRYLKTYSVTFVHRSRTKHKLLNVIEIYYCVLLLFIECSSSCLDEHRTHLPCNDLDAYDTANTWWELGIKRFALLSGVYSDRLEAEPVKFSVFIYFESVRTSDNPLD